LVKVDAGTEDVEADEPLRTGDLRADEGEETAAADEAISRAF
jgi:hypothetical protein